MNAETIAKALGGRKAGATWMACCPAHDDHAPSLSIADTKCGKVLVRCHAGCDQRDVIAALRACGAWEAAARYDGRFRRNLNRRSPAERPPDALKRTQAALAIWQASQPAKGSLVETYLRTRGLTVAPPDSIRLHAGLKHPSGGIWPAMVALVTHGMDGAPIAIHRTFLAREGNGKAPVDPAKMMLGPCRGGVVRLVHPGDVLMVGEGIETCLAAMQATGLAAWAALSTSGLRALDLPRDLRDVIVLADGDDAGEAAAHDCAWRWKREGRRVRIAQLQTDQSRVHTAAGRYEGSAVMPKPRPHLIEVCEGFPKGPVHLSRWTSLREYFPTDSVYRPNPSTAKSSFQSAPRRTF
jgi:putative DNA primase/helicase